MTSLEKPIKWFYVFSPRYEVFHIILRSLIGETQFFDVQPIAVPQEVYSNLYKPGASHFMSGNTVRFEVLLDVMSKMPDGEQFIFSDVDLFVKNMNSLIKTINDFKDNDLVFMRDNEQTNHLNIGFGLIKNSIKMRALFKQTLDTIVSTGGAEQDIINEIIKSFPSDYMSIKAFPIPDFSQSNFTNVGASYMFQMLCSSKDPDANIFEKLISVASISNLAPLKQKIQPNIWNTLVIWMKQNHPTNPLASESFVLPVVQAVLGTPSILLQAGPK